MSQFADPIPVKLDKPTDAVVRKLKAGVNLSYSEVLRRCVRYSAPLFLSGAVDIARIPEIAPPAKASKRPKG